MGGTMRLGADPIKLHPDTRAREIYGEAVIYERHRHRYEVNNFLRRRLEAAGPRDLRHVARRAPGRDHRDRRPPVLRRLAVPPRVQVAPRAPRAAVPRVRRRRARRARARARGRRASGARAPPSARASPPALTERRRPRRSAVRPACEAEKARLADTFAALCRIPSPFGHERACADRVARRAARHGARGRRGRRRRTPGRVRQPARAHRRAARERSILLCAHLDTVETAAADRAGARRRRLGERQRRHPRRRQQGRGGGDARGRAALQRRGLAGRDRAAVHRLRGERAGRAPRRSTRARCASDFGYVFDHATPIGEVVVASPTYFRDRRRLPRPRRARRHPPRGRAAARSSPPRTPSRRCRSGASTSRRPPTSARSTAASGPPTSSPSAAALLAETRSLDAGARRGGRRRASSTPSTTAPRTPSATSTSRPRGCSSATAPKPSAPAVRGRRGGAARVRLRAAADRHRRRLGRQRARGGRAARA